MIKTEFDIFVKFDKCERMYNLTHYSKLWEIDLVGPLLMLTIQITQE